MAARGPATLAVGSLLSGRVSIITGASSGLGRATALAFMRQGAIVVCADRSTTQPAISGQQQKSTVELLRAEGGKSIFAETDVSNEKSVQSLVKTAVQEFGRVDIMVNNAGIAPEASNPRPVWETPMDVFDATWGVNVRGVFLGSKYAGAQMREQARLPELPKAGTIINMASVLGVLGKPGTAAYAAAKGAVISMTRAVAMDYAPHGIHCNSILPGFTRTPMISSMTDSGELERYVADCHPMKRLGEPEEIANAAVFLASDMSSGITGLNMSVDGGLHSQLRL